MLGGALHSGWRFAFVGRQMPFYVASLFWAMLLLPFEELDFACGRHRNMSHVVLFKTLFIVVASSCSESQLCLLSVEIQTLI